MKARKQTAAILAMVAILGLTVGILGGDPAIGSPAQSPTINWIRLDWSGHWDQWILHWAFDHQFGVEGTFSISDGSGRWLCHDIGQEIPPARAGECFCRTDFSAGDGWAGCHFDNRDPFYMVEPAGWCFAWIWWEYPDGSRDPLDTLFVECPRLWVPIVIRGGS